MIRALPISSLGKSLVIMHILYGLELITSINPYGVDFLIKNTIQKLKECSEDKKIKNLPILSERNKYRYSFTNFLEQIKVDC